jgi:hypothetical protein
MEHYQHQMFDESKFCKAKRSSLCGVYLETALGTQQSAIYNTRARTCVHAGFEFVLSLSVMTETSRSVSVKLHINARALFLSFPALTLYFA